MLWFQHHNNASDDVKIRRLEKKFGLKGYAIFFKLLEKIAKEGKKYRLSVKKYPIDTLSNDFHLKEDELKTILEYMGNIGLISQKSLKQGILYVPNMKNYADEYTKKRRRVSGHYPDNVRQEEIRLDKNRKEEKRRGFFQNQPIRKDKNGKLWVIPKEGGKWLEFCGDLKNIVWK